MFLYQCYGRRVRTARVYFWLRLVRSCFVSVAMDKSMPYTRQPLSRTRKSGWEGGGETAARDPQASWPVTFVVVPTNNE